VTHHKGNCPKIATAQANAVRSVERREHGRRGDLQVDLEGVSGGLRSTVAGCVESLSGVCVVSGATLEQHELGELVVLLTDRDITFAGFRAEILRRMCDPDTDATMTARLSAVLTASAVGQKDVRTEVLAGPGMPKVGPLEKILDALIRKVRADCKHQAAPTGDHTVKLDVHGRQYYEVRAGGEEMGDAVTLCMVLELFRHVMVGLGEGTEHAMHYFCSWHLRRLTYGERLAVIALTFRMLVREADATELEWLDLINGHAHRILADARAATGADIFRSQAPTTQQVTSAGEIQGTPTAKEACQRWNTEDPDNRGSSKTCLYTNKKGCCKFAHKCSGCEGPLPKWKCGCA
jgi:hypothetical protein